VTNVSGTSELRPFYLHAHWCFSCPASSATPCMVVHCDLRDEAFLPAFSPHRPLQCNTDVVLSKKSSVRRAALFHKTHETHSTQAVSKKIPQKMSDKEYRLHRTASINRQRRLLCILLMRKMLRCGRTKHRFCIFRVQKRDKENSTFSRHVRYT